MENFFSSKILIVDDNPANVLLLEGILQETGYEDIVCVTDPRQVEELTLNERFDLILLDIRMPHISGFEILDMIRARDTREFLPILVLTAQTDSDTRINALEKGADDFLTKPFDHVEVLKRIHNLLRTRHLHLASLDREVVLEGKVEESNREIVYLATHDTATGLPNRNHTLNKFVSMLEKSGDADQHTVLAVLTTTSQDIHALWGHQTVDRLYAEVGQRMHNLLDQDIIAGSWGCDEYVLLVRDKGHFQELQPIVEEIKRYLELPYKIDDSEISLKTRIAAARFPMDADAADELVKKARLALSYCTEGDAGGFCVYTQQMSEELAHRHRMEAALKKAVENNELISYYQPKIDIATGRVSGMEALLRWHNPSLGMIAPGQFIPLVESMGLINSFGLWILEQACRDTVQLHQKGYDNLSIAVNVSRQQLAQEEFIVQVLEILDRTGLPPHLLELEVTESTIMHSSDMGNMILLAFRHKGIGVAIDDFGTGFSSLSQLRQLPISTLKVDRSFVRHINEDAGDLAIAKMIVSLAATLDLKVVAEGVEEYDHLKLLEQIGCDIAQGFYFSKPLPIAEFEAYLESQK